MLQPRIPDKTKRSIVNAIKRQIKKGFIEYTTHYTQLYEITCKNIGFGGQYSKNQMPDIFIVTDKKTNTKYKAKHYYPTWCGNVHGWDVDLTAETGEGVK